MYDALIELYAKCGLLKEAMDLWDTIPTPAKNVYSWTSTINAHGVNGQAKKALELFDQMIKQKVEPNRVTFIVLLNACRSDYSLLSLIQPRRTLR